MRARKLTTLAAAGLTLAVIGSSTLLGGGAAVAAPGDPTAPVKPGDAAAIGAIAALQVKIGSIIDFQQVGQVGTLVTSVPGEDAHEESNVTLIDALIADLTVGHSLTASESTRDRARAAATVEDTSANLLGHSIVSLDTASASAECPADGSAEAAVHTAGLRILGIPVTLDDTTPAAERTVPLGNAVQYGPDAVGDVADLSGIDLTVRIAQVHEASPEGAASISLAVQVILDGTFGADVFNSTVVGNLILASAACITPAPLTVTAVSPASGSTKGGEKITITGTGFTTGTTVTVGGVAATDVEIDPTGTTLTARTPAGVPGDTTITVTTSYGASASIAYRYVAPTLAATGVDTTPGLLAGAGVFGFGVVLLGLDVARRRRVAQR